MASGARIGIRQGPEFTAVANALREVDRALPRWFRKELKKAVKPLVTEAKNDVRRMPVAGHSGSTGLRRRVARGVGVRVGVGQNAYMRITTSMANPDEAVIPRGFDRPSGWKHPLFGNPDRDTWVTQHALQPGWFVETFADGRDDIRGALEDVLERARDIVAQAGGGPGPSA